LLSLTLSYFEKAFYCIRFCQALLCSITDFLEFEQLKCYIPLEKASLLHLFVSFLNNFTGYKKEQIFMLRTALIIGEK